jgi:hypothetical protein
MRMAISPRFAIRTDVRAADGLAVEEVEVVESRRGRRVALCRMGRRLFRMERMLLEGLGAEIDVFLR